MWRRSDALLLVVTVVLALGLTGCATKIRNVPNQALAKQTVTVVERDRRDCEKGITGRVKGVWFPAELEFAACMTSRNYQVYVQVLDASVEVKRASLRGKISAARILSDLVACEHIVEEKVSMAEKIGRPALSVAGVFFWPASIGSMAAAATLAVSRQRDYTVCMTPRGYVVTPWQADDRTQQPQDRTSP
jgi:hypothetical protein